MKTIVEEWPVAGHNNIDSVNPEVKFFAKEIKSGRRSSKPHVIYLLLEEKPPIDYSEVEIFADLIGRERSVH